MFTKSSYLFLIKFIDLFLNQPSRNIIASLISILNLISIITQLQVGCGQIKL